MAKSKKEIINDIDNHFLLAAIGPVLFGFLHWNNE